MIYRNITFVSLLNFLTRVMGYLRDLLIAFIFGTSTKAELFIILLEIKELFNFLFHSLSFEKNLINKYLQKKNKFSKFSFSNNIFLSFLFIVIAITLISLIFSTKIFYTLFPGFVGRLEIEYVDKIIKYVLLFNIFNFIIVYLSSILQAEKKFIFNSIILMLPNFFFLFYFYVISSFFDYDLINNLFGLFIISVSIFQIILILIKDSTIFRGLFVFNFKSLIVDLIEFLSSYLYSFLFIITFTVYRFIEKFFLSFEEGLISIFYLSERVAHLPTAIIITAFSTILLPEFYSKKNNIEKRKLRIFSNSLIYCLIIMFYVCLFYILNSEIIIDILFGRGNFSKNSTEITSNIFEQKTFGIFFLAFHLILYVFFISMRKNKTILIGSILGLVASLSFMLILYLNENFKYFGFNLLIFYSIQVVYLFYKLENKSLNFLRKDLLNNLQFIYSFFILTIILIMLKILIQENQTIILLLSIFLIIFHFYISIKFRLLKDQKLSYLLKKF